MADASQKNKAKVKQPEVIPALDIYQQQSCTLDALKQAIVHGLANKEKDLIKTLQKQIFQAAGQDQYRLHLHDQHELHAALSLSLAIVDKTDKVQDWLEILETADYWNPVRLTNISALLNKAAHRLATHIPKVRNPANEGAPRFAKMPCSDTTAIAAGEAALSIATIEGDATLVGARFFFEFVFFLNGVPTSVLEMLINKDLALSGFLSKIGLDAATITMWQSAAKQSPKQLAPLHAQLLLANNEGEWLSITPVLSVATSSWLGQWRKECLIADNISQESNRPLFAIESAEYGGTNARNIASILMDFSGKQYHPKIQPPPVRREAIDRLARLIHRPSVLINPRKLFGKVLEGLSKSYDELPNEQRTQKLVLSHSYNVG